MKAWILKNQAPIEIITMNEVKISINKKNVQYLRDWFSNYVKTFKHGDKKLKEIDNLNNHLMVCNECRLSSTRKNVLLGEGNVDTRLMIIESQKNGY